ncbi:MAG: alpha/beta hydrolase [Rhodospirillaceae bacterium]
MRLGEINVGSRTEFRIRALTQLLAAITVLAVVLAGCGGGGGGGAVQPPSSGGADSSSGGGQSTRESSTIGSRITGTNYALNIYLPPASAGARGDVPIVYMLDGESWFETLVDIVETTRTGLIIVGINSMGQRNRDFVPVNTCTGGGGGHAAYFDFIRRELIPHVEGKFGGNPSRRALFGHSHGGSFVLYATFSESPGQHTFKAYLASEASIACMPATAFAWEQVYASAYRELPARLHISSATGGNASANFEYANMIAQRNYAGLVFRNEVYGGSHTGIVPQVLKDAIAFAFPISP